MKTITLPEWLRPHAARLHAFLSAAPAAEWIFTCPALRSPGELSVPCPVLTVTPLDSGSNLSWLQNIESITTTIRPSARLAPLLRGHAALDLGDGVQLQLHSSLAGHQITSRQIVAGRVPLPPLDVLIPNLPDPIAHALAIVPHARAFSLHLTGGIFRTAFTVRLEF